MILERSKKQLENTLISLKQKQSCIQKINKLKVKMVKTKKN